MTTEVKTKNKKMKRNTRVKQDDNDLKQNLSMKVIKHILF